VRYEADGEPLFAGLCYCADCRKASGSGFIPFMAFPRSAVRLTGQTRAVISKSARGGDAVRNFCPVCGSLLFGGTIGRDDTYNFYAGSLDDPSAFEPRIAIFTRDRPGWALIPPGLKTFAALPE
jgi:hypothetical protein